MAEQRASDDDRERAADQLRRAGGDGRLSVDELDERVQIAFRARTRGELERLVEDVADEHPAPRPATSGGGSGVVVRKGDGGARWVLSIMSGAERFGRWRVSPRCAVVNVMGGGEIDFSEAELAADEVTVTVFSFMGGADIYVPEDIRVEVTSVGIMGGNDVEPLPAAAAIEGGPVLRLRLVSIMAGTNVRRGSRAQWRERRAARKLERRRERELRRGDAPGLRDARRDERR